MIKQQLKTDCGIATLANFLGADYDYALSVYGENRAFSGVTIQETASILFSHGLITTYIPLSGFSEACGISIQAQNPEILERLGRPAIVQVMNRHGVIHQVFFDGKLIHDPSTNVTSTMFVADYECVVDCLILLSKEGFDIKSGVENGR
ncbi:hypothetical protein SBP02_11970 [Pseudomonas benzenivorans]|uniref:Peptidase C39 family protein n=1 Tax=Pseudomonas benzenivorans TaxID=556533 RepID=A0ABZ0PS41_9PSED|nr:hypothetical protein [Pseudomonas benzenivorans]WPC03502.1 hypothetical protein SBP02_11970 [Pseudomonas benzenivorans]